MATKTLHRVARSMAAVAALALSLTVSADRAEAQAGPVITGQIEWGVYVAPDGCMRWWADGGLEGYMVTRFHPNTNRPYCLQTSTCLTESTDVLFATDSHHLTHQGRARLEQFFRSENAFGYAVYGHTDERASHPYNQALSERRANSVAQVARSVGAVVETVAGFGETRPRAQGHSEHAWRQNRRVEVVCYHLPE